MTGMEGLLDWFAASRELAAADGRRDLQDARLRALPREDIFFYVKTIDNTRVRCVEARRDWLGSALASACVLLLAMSLIVAVTPACVVRVYDAQIEQLKRQREARLNGLRMLLAERARLLSPENLEQYAGDHFVTPSPEGTVIAAPGRGDVARLGKR